MKIFILKPSSLGDIVQALPVLRLIKQEHPQSEIFWWVDSSLAPLLEGDPDLAGLILFDRQRWRSPWHWMEAWQSALSVREHHFDWVIDLQSLLRSGMMAWFANGSFTVGLDDAREGARGLYDIFVPRPSPQTHAVDWYLETLQHLGVPRDREFVWLPPRPEVTNVIREKWAPENHRWIVLQPGARWLNKRWPVEHFAELACQLSAVFPDVRCAILGSAADQQLGHAITQAAPKSCLDLTGKLSLQEMIGWIRLSDLMVTNDTGPMHVAAALGKPTVTLFGPTDPRRTGPYRQVDQALQLDLPCVPCMKDRCHYSKPLECLRAVSPEAVMSRVQRRLEAPVSSPVIE